MNALTSSTRHSLLILLVLLLQASDDALMVRGIGLLSANLHLYSEQGCYAMYG
jgi:hypothetical protein